MSDQKTKATDASVDTYLASRATPAQLEDCKALMEILRRVTNEEPRMWGPSIVGYGRYQYRYESGRTGESCATGFAIRGRELVVYLMIESPNQAALLAKLGKHKIGKSCLYLKSLADINTAILNQLIVESLAALQERYGA